MHEDCFTSHFAAASNYLLEAVKRGKSKQSSIPSLNKAMLLTTSEFILYKVFFIGFGLFGVFRSGGWCLFGLGFLYRRELKKIQIL